MDRMYAAYTALTAPPLPVSPETGFPRGGDIGVSPTRAGPYWFHMITESLRNVIVGAGLTPSAADLTLLDDAIRAIASAAAGAAAEAAVAAIPPPPAAVGFPCRAWVNFHGIGAVGDFLTIRASGNVTSVQKLDTGKYKITFTTAMPTPHYAVSLSFSSYRQNTATAKISGDSVGLEYTPENMTTTELTIQVAQGGSVDDFGTVTAMVVC